MTISGKFFPGQENEEKVFFLIRKHWFNYIIFFVLTFLMVLPVGGFLFYVNFVNPEILADQVIYVGSVSLISIYFLAIMALLLYGIIDFYLDVYIITDRRIVDITQNGLFKRQISELHLRQVQDVNAKVEGFAQTLLHFGDVHIQTAGERANFVFQSIPHPYTIAKEIIDLHEKQIGDNGGDLGSGLNSADVEGGENNAAKGLPINAAFSKSSNDKPIIMASSDSMASRGQSDNFKDGSGNVNNKGANLLNKDVEFVNNNTVSSGGELVQGQEIDLNENETRRF